MSWNEFNQAGHNARRSSTFHSIMKRLLTHTLASLALASIVSAASPEVEAAFIAKYQKAIEASDTKTLEGFLHTKGAEEETIEFFKMMQSAGAGQKVSKIELVKPDAEQRKKLNAPMEMPDGKMYKLPVQPEKQLVITIEEKNGDSTSKSTSKVPVAEIDGKLVIPVPVPAK
jgi:hypothetical protein